jgi:hypothetical protein
MKLFWIVAIFFVVGGYIIYSSMSADLDTTSGKLSFAKELGKWLFQVGKSTKNTVGYAVEQDWLPDINKTNSTNSSFK